jgi:hypothetical protein
MHKGFGYTQKGPIEIWEDNASCIMTSLSKKLINRDRSEQVDVIESLEVHFLRDLVCGGHVKPREVCGNRMSLTPSRKDYRDQHLRSIESFYAVYDGNRNAFCHPFYRIRCQCS